jgi:hypothetical protein
VEESVIERVQQQWPRLEEETAGVAPWRLAALAPIRAEDLETQLPGHVEEEVVSPQLLEEQVVAVVVRDGALLLVGGIQCGDGFSPDEFRRGF